MSNAAWEQRIAEATDPVKKNALIAGYARFKQQAAQSVTKYDSSLVRKVSPGCIPFVYFYCMNSEQQDTPYEKKVISKTLYHCTRMGKPFAEVSPVDGKVEVSEDLSVLNFHLAQVNDWTSTKVASISSTGTVVIKMSKVMRVPSGWYKFGSFTVGQNTSKRDGRVYTNITCQTVEPWAEGPSYMAMHGMACRLWTNERYMPRPVDPKFYPSPMLVSEVEAEMLHAKGVQQPAKETTEESASSSSSSSSKPAVDYDLHDKAYAEAFNRHLRALGVESWQLHPELCQQHPNSRHPYIIPLILGKNGSAVKDDKNAMVLTDHQPVFFDEDIRVKRDGKVREFTSSEKNPFTMHLEVNATTSVFRTALDTGECEMINLGIAVRGQTFFNYLGVVDPFIAQGVLPRVLSTIPMTIIGSLDTENTRDKNNSVADGSCSLGLDVFSFPLIDYLEMIRANSVQVTASFAAHKVYEYMRMCKPSLKPRVVNGKEVVETKVNAGELADNDELGVRKFVLDNNMVSKLSGNRIFNCMESKFLINAKKGTSTHRFYAMTGLVPDAAKLEAYYTAATRFHAAAPDSDEARTLHNELEQHAAAFSAELMLKPGLSEIFGINEQLARHDIAATTVIWAIDRELDHVTRVDYDNEEFTLEAVKKRAAHLHARADSKQSKPASSVPVVIEETPSLDADVVEAVLPIDDEVVTEEVPRARKRAAPTSPGKRSAVSKKERIR